MSHLSRISSLASLLCSRRIPIAALVRPVVVIQQPPLRYATRVADPESDSISRRGYFDDSKLLKDKLRVINEQVQRHGRVPFMAVEDAVKCAERIGSISGVETTLLLRATGSFLRDRVRSERAKLTERVWNLTPKDRLDISHFNTFLHVQLENGMKFDPSNFLQLVSNAQVIPNRVTYQRLVQRYCDMGDIQNATKIIEFMKAEGVPLSERVFHSLITGHLKKGDPEAARNILNVMQEANLYPTKESYAALAEGLAENGDSQGALEILFEHQLLDEHILRIVKAFAMRDDAESIEKAMSLLSDATVNFSNTNSVCMELLAEGKLDIALQMYLHVQQKSVRRNNSGFLVLQAARTGYPASEALRLLEALKPLGCENDVIIEATRLVVSSGNRALADEYLQAMKDLGFPIRAHYYLPFLCAAKDEAGVLSELSVIASLESPSFDLIEEFVLPRLEKSDVDTLHAKLTGVGVPSDAVSNALVRTYLRDNRLAEAEKVLLEYNVSRLSGLASFAAIAMNATGDLATAVRVLKLLTEHGDPRAEMVARFLERAGPMLNEAVQAIAETDMKISLKSYSRLMSACINVEPLKNQVVDISEPRREKDFDLDRPTAEVESLLATAEAKNEDTSRYLKRLLNDYCRQRNHEKVEEVLRKLPTSLMTGANMSLLVEYYINQKDSQRATHFFDLAIERNFVLNPHRVLGLAKLFVEEKRLFEAAELLEKSSTSLAISMENLGVSVEGRAARLLLAIFETYGKDACVDFYDRYISKYSDGRLLGILVADQIGTNLLEACEIFRDIVAKYKVAPCRKRLYKKLIEENKTEEFDTIREIVEKNIGRVDFASDMVACYLECNKPEQARLMLSSCTGTRGRANLVRLCNGYLDESETETLVALLNLMDEVGVERGVSCLYRIKLCDWKNDFTAALDVWTQAQEDNVVLDSAALVILADLLKRNEQPIPFVVPEAVAIEQSSSSARPSRIVADRSLEENLKYRESLKLKSRKLKEGDLVYLLKQLMLKDMIKEALDVALDFEDSRDLLFRTKLVVNQVFDAAVTKGMIDELEAFVEASGGFGQGALQKAYQVAGRLDEYVTKAESQVSGAMFLAVTKEAMESDPAIAARIEKLAHRKAVEKGDYRMIVDLWYLHIINSELDKAIELQEKYPALLDALTKSRGRPSLRKWFDRDFFERLLQVTENPTIRSKALYSVLVELTSKKHIAEAQSCLNSATSLGIDTSKMPTWIQAKMDADDSTPDVGSESQSRLDEVEARVA